MTISKMEAEREMDALVKELYGLVPETPVETEVQELRQRVAGALARILAERSTDDKLPITLRGIQAGNLGAFEAVLKWIDEIAEGKDNEHDLTPN